MWTLVISDFGLVIFLFNPHSNNISVPTIFAPEYNTSIDLLTFSNGAVSFWGGANSSVFSIDFNAPDAVCFILYTWLEYVLYSKYKPIKITTKCVVLTDLKYYQSKIIDI